jgi:hypothetical protein
MADTLNERFRLFNTQLVTATAAGAAYTPSAIAKYVFFALDVGANPVRVGPTVGGSFATGSPLFASQKHGPYPILPDAVKGIKISFFTSAGTQDVHVEEWG